MTINPTLTQQGETPEPPERIRVVVRAATSDDWIGVAYCKDYTGDPSTIHEYARTAVAGPQGVIELLSASLLHPESAEGYVRQAIEMLSAAATASPTPGSRLRSWHPPPPQKTADVGGEGG